MVICLLFTILFMVQASYVLFGLKPHFFNSPVNSLWNKSALLRQPYMALIARAYRNFRPLYSQTHGPYHSGSIPTSTSIILFSNLIHTSSSMVACRKAPGMSIVATNRPSIASSRHVAINAGVDKVGDDDSALVICSRCLRPSAHPRPLIFPLRFRLRNIRYESDSIRMWCVTRSHLTGSITPRP